MAVSDTQYFDEKIWDGVEPKYDVGSTGVDAGGLDDYADDIARRVIYLQARSRGFLTRFRRKGKKSPIKPSRSAHPRQERLSDKEHTPNEQYSGAKRKRSPSPVGRMVETRIEEKPLLQLDAHTFEQTIDVLPQGWTLELDDHTPRPSSVHSSQARNEGDGKHPYHEAAHLVYGKTFHFTEEYCRWHNERDSVSRALYGDQVPTIAEIALASQARRPGGMQDWWISATQITPESSTLCSACRHIDFACLLNTRDVQVIKLKPVKRPPIDTESLACPFCRLILTSMNIEISPESPGASSTMLSCSLEVVNSDGETACFYIQLQDVSTYDFRSLRIDVFLDKEQIQQAITEKVNLGLIRAWLNQCDREHLHYQGKGISDKPMQPCSMRGLTTTPFTGLTLVDVVDLCIVEPGTLPRYIALSYVWGTEQTLLNTTTSWRGLHKGGALAVQAIDLPQTIRDAMSFVSQLGERYLWVDSLCIIQDDEVEKLKQINNMGPIYRHAYFTLVAAYGTNCHDGLPGLEPATRLELHTPVSIQGLTLVHPLPEYRWTVPKSTWNSRCWTYQEGELCPKHVIFTEHQVFYRCNRAIYSEEKGMEPIEHLDAYTCKMNLTGTPNIIAWADAVPLFTQRAISDKKDVLNAFAGLENLLQPFFRIKFVYGLPESELDLALLWQPDFTKPFRRRVDYTARRVMFPSWSWAGWEGAVLTRQWSDHLGDD